jgi:hypothetical protein
LADLLAASLPDGAAAPAQEASLGFFLDPVAVGDLCLANADLQRPTLVVALDFVFWFGYGEVASEAQRLERLELGLEMLERFECPIVVGDLPDLCSALEGRGPWGGPMLFPSQVPAPATLAELNQRLAAWAGARPRVVLVPLASFIERLRRGEVIELRGNRWGEGALAELLQPDRMHPTLAGGAALCVLALDALARARPALALDGVEWRTAAIAGRARAAKAAEREANRARRERRRAQDPGSAPPGEGGGGAAPQVDPPREREEQRGEHRPLESERAVRDERVGV